MQQIFERIHTELNRLKEKYQSDIDISFNDGATDDDFNELEKVLGFELPNDFKEIYRIHNGAKSDSTTLAGEEWLSIRRIIIDYEMWNELFEAGDFDDVQAEPSSLAIKAEFWFNPKWIPFTTRLNGDGRMIDLDPSESGTVGQIIYMYHDDTERRLENICLKDFFEQYANDLENDKYIITSDYHCIVRVNETDDFE